MKMIRAGLACGLLLALAACGGSSSKNDCGDMAKKVLECIPDIPYTEEEYAAACEANLTCADPGRQEALDCVVALECGASFLTSAQACLVDNDCGPDPE